jgi:nicotinamidase-related amidase
MNAEMGDLRNPDRDKTIKASETAFLINDMIRGNFDAIPEKGELLRRTDVIGETARAVALARKHGVQIYWITITPPPYRIQTPFPITDELGWPGGAKNAPGDANWRTENVDELPVQEGDRVVSKVRIDPFYATSLELDLRLRGYKNLMISGVNTVAGVENIARSAFDMGFNGIVLREACYWCEEDLHQWSLDRIMPRLARVRTIDEAFHMIEGE